MNARDNINPFLVERTNGTFRYGKYTIRPAWVGGWQYTHDDYDGAEDAWNGGRDPRFNAGLKSPEECVQEIDEIEGDAA